MLSMNIRGSTWRRSAGSCPSPRIAGVDPDDLVIHVVGSDTSDVLGHLRSRGVTVRSIDRFDSRSPHCNKVAAALRMAEEQHEGLVVLCDTDVAVLEDPRSLVLPPGSIGGKVVDTPVPPLDVLHEIFAVAEVPAPPITPLPWGDHDATFVGNSNGGLYLVPATILPVLAPAWETWARWLLERRELLRDWTFHLDQVAMVLALTSEGIASDPLDVRWNTPIHDLTRIPADPPTPAVIHYHQEIDTRGRIRMTGFSSIDHQIERVNEAIGLEWQEAFPTTTFWRWWNLTHPGLATASGDGGAQLLGVRDLLISVLSAVVSGFGPQCRPWRPRGNARSPDATLCGDRRVSRSSPFGYVGAPRRRIPRGLPRRRSSPSRPHDLPRHVDQCVQRGGLPGSGVAIVGLG